MWTVEVFERGSWLHISAQFPQRRFAEIRCQWWREQGFKARVAHCPGDPHA